MAFSSPDISSFFFAQVGLGIPLFFIIVYVIFLSPYVIVWCILRQLLTFLYTLCYSVKTVKNSDINIESCAICFEDFDETTKIVKSSGCKCNIAYCTTCFAQWGQCAVCGKAPVETRNIHRMKRFKQKGDILFFDLLEGKYCLLLWVIISIPLSCLTMGPDGFYFDWWDNFPGDIFTMYWKLFCELMALPYCIMFLLMIIFIV